ncbi:medium chain fatty-acid-CoA ligase FadD14 [Mycolicibacterium aurum]|uniref:Long-chain-fatty-acid--CoA ligase FadD13 n=1 Tax=Mycolicibacterium aurum TaxID=1791 RepID=A0A3S4RKC7_MYCAU|nr:medium chain fatty-acid-CoA ligase FadD14 [Mycolicibacterium aurum]
MVKSTMQDFPLTIPAILRHGLQVHGGRRVLTLDADGTARGATFTEVGRHAAQLAHALRELGVSGDGRVGTFMWNNQEHVEAYLAIPSIGAVLHTLNLRLSVDQVSYIANHAQDQVILVDGSLIEQFAPILPKLQSVKSVIVTGDADTGALEGSGKTVYRYRALLENRPADFEWPKVDESSAAGLCYTSGTTGNPKGVAFSHRSTFLHSMAVMAKDGFQFGANDTVLALVPQFHANAWGSIYAAFMAGSELLLPDRNLHSESLVRAIHNHRPTIAIGVPTIWADIANYLEKHPEFDISSLEFVAVGGSAASRHLMEELEKHGVTLTQAWGMTETSPLAAIARPSSTLKGEDRWRIRITQGRPVPGVETRIVDDAGDSLPHDGVAVGEVEVRGPWITGSYFGDDDSGRFHDGWLRTGDAGTIDENQYLTLTDRIKDVIKSGGEWISSVELELLIASHPDVAEASVIGVPDDRWQERPLAVVVIKENHTVTPEQLREFLSDKVAKWWLPERWTFVEAVPRTSVGKFDKRALRSQHAEGAFQVLEVRG